jgi:hypothetical protein
MPSLPGELPKMEHPHPIQLQLLPFPESLASKISIRTISLHFQGVYVTCTDWTPRTATEQYPASCVPALVMIGSISQVFRSRLHEYQLASTTGAVMPPYYTHFFHPVPHRQNEKQLVAGLCAMYRMTPRKCKPCKLSAMIIILPVRSVTMLVFSLPAGSLSKRMSRLPSYPLDSRASKRT